MPVWLSLILLLGLATTARAEQADSIASVPMRPRPRVAAPT